MKKSKPGIEGIHDTGHLFRSAALARHRSLILPKYLNDEAAKPIHHDLAAEEAHKILVKWANLESNGHLAKKEISLDSQFLDEVFGDALHYLPSAKKPDGYQLEHKFSVPDVGIADGALGSFPPDIPANVRVVIELKDATTDLDHDKIKGRTPVKQCWDYLYSMPDCPWGIVSNFVSFRLYHRDKTPQAFEYFELQKLRSIDEFRRFYVLFERNGLLPNHVIKVPRAFELMQRSTNKQREVGDKLYDYYSEQRYLLIDELKQKHKFTAEQAIRAAQKLLDRIIFIAFCEDRGLLPHKLLEHTWKNVPPLARATNPRWQNFLDTFHAIDKGHANLDLKEGYNGGLFAADPEIDRLDLSDHWAEVFKSIGDFDFAEDVNVDVLGHIFEKSITELEKLRTTGFFEAQTPGAAAPAMPKSAERKRFGIYYTPPAFTSFIVRRTIGALIEERLSNLAKSHKVDPDQSLKGPRSETFAAYWQAVLDSVRQIAVVDPACGSGAFLIQAYELFEEQYDTIIDHLAYHTNQPTSTWSSAIPEMILAENIHGVDLSPQAVEITQLALWIRSARKGRRLDDLSHNIICRNSLVGDKAVDPRAMDWKQEFPNIFARKNPGFDAVIGNPPWERMKVQEREFFAFSAPDIASAANAADRRKMVEALRKKIPLLHATYLDALSRAEKSLAYARSCGEFPLTGKGDVNLYMLFAELASRILSSTGRAGLLLPSGIATDHTTKDFFGGLVESKRLHALYDFVNRLGLFADVEGRLKFSILFMNGQNIPTVAADFVFWAERIEDINDKKRHVQLTAADLKLMNPNTLTCPIFRSNRDAELTKAIYRRVPILIDENRKTGGNPWEIRFVRMFDQTNDAEHFLTGDKLKADGFKLTGNRWVKGKQQYLPLFEAKMTRDYDHRASKVALSTGNWYMNYTAESASLVEHQNPEFLPIGRWWVNEKEIVERASESLRTAAIGFHDIARANDTRTMVACMIPYAAVANTVPLILNTGISPWRRFCCLLANLNSLPYDFVTRQKTGGAHLNFFIVEQIPTLPPDTYDEKCPWDKKQTLEKWISERVLKLSCTAEDMIPLAEAAGFKEKIHKWKDAERAELRAELDAAYFHLYGISREDAEYILSTFSGMVDDDGPTLTGNSAAKEILQAYDDLASNIK
jgi:type I restriction-modification system DNA methylase subunit